MSETKEDDPLAEIAVSDTAMTDFELIDCLQNLDTAIQNLAEQNDSPKMYQDQVREIFRAARSSTWVIITRSFNKTSQVNDAISTLTAAANAIAPEKSANQEVAIQSQALIRQKVESLRTALNRYQQEV